jgi:signal transduction histidine kinase
VVAEIRQVPEVAETAIILLTARGEQHQLVEGLEAGADDYLSKPFSHAELMTRIKAQLRRRDAELAAQKRERLASMGTISAGFAHEVRNPLNGMVNSIEPLKESVREAAKTGDPSAALEFVDIVQLCSNRISQLGDQFLNFARNPLEKMESINIVASLDSAISVVKWGVKESIQIIRDYDCRDWVVANAGMLNQVWVNLLDNAVRAMGERGGTLTIRTMRRDQEVLVSLIDTGAGIPPEHLERLGEPFFSTRSPGEGTGLGLAICQRIIAKHGGKLDVKSKLGEGSNFTIVLPMSRTEAEVRPQIEAHSSPKPSTGDPINSADDRHSRSF